jgi:RNA polymerase sigma-70 factor (ECF subfamily)
MTKVDDERALAFAAERSHLLAVAFRILGSEIDAQDIVQEAWLRYARSDTARVNNLQAWLTTVVTRLCLDLLRRTRESLLDLEDFDRDLRSSDTPEDIAILAAELTEAFVVALDRLSPEQRVALVLHDVFGTPFEEVAHVLATTTGSAKKLASRARSRLAGDFPRSSRASDDAVAERVVCAFLTAAKEGNVDALVAVLHPDVTRTADPQALPHGSPQRVVGIEAVVAETRELRANARAARLASVDGRPGIVVEVDDAVVSALVLQIADGKVRHYDVVADPGRLARLRIERNHHL